MKTLRNAGIASLISVGIWIIVVIFLYLLPSIWREIPGYFYYLLLGYVILSTIMSVFIYSGFIIIGKKLQNNFLITVSKISIIFIAINLIAYLIFFFFQKELFSNILSFLPLRSFLIITLGFALIKLKDKIKLANIGGTLLISGGSLMAIIAIVQNIYKYFFLSKMNLSSLLYSANLSNIISLIPNVAFVIIAIIFFNASKKYETTKTNKNKKNEE